jgi:hypothetical protein
MKRGAVADRIVTYCDALVAFSLVNGLAFLVALGEPDIRCSIAGIAGFVAIMSGSIPVASTFLILWLRRYEQRLRGDEAEDELVARFWNVVGFFRLGLIWFFACVVLIGIWAATKDVSCQAGLG